MSELVCVARFLSAPDAHVARAKLEALGIESVVRDQYFVMADWLLSQAAGGVKLFVASEDAAEAVAALERDDSAALGDVPESSLPPAESERCPRCGSIGAVGAPRSHRFRVLSLLASFPFPFARRWLRCPGCRHEWVERQGGAA